MWHTYLLLCKDQTVYTGITNDLAKRVAAHKSGAGSKYVRSRGFKKILHTETFKSKSLALKREAAIKKLTRTQKLALITKTRKRD